MEVGQFLVVALVPQPFGTPLVISLDEGGPFDDQSLCSRRQRAVDKGKRVNINLGCLSGVSDMKMRRIMIPIVDLNDDPVESGDLRLEVDDSEGLEKAPRVTCRLVGGRGHRGRDQLSQAIPARPIR